MTKSPFNTDTLIKVGLLDFTKVMPDMEPFRQTAKYFEENGHYPYYIPGKMDKVDTSINSKFRQFWDRERERCRNGMWHQGDYISGDNYAHLNYGRMWVLDISEADQLKLDAGEKITVNRKSAFPDPWDGTWHIFNYFEEAKRRQNHAGVIKCRGTGASYIFTSIGCNTYFHTPGGRVFVLAPSEAQLTGTDALLFRMWEQMDFIDNNTPFFKIREGGKSNTSMVRKSKHDIKKAGLHSGKASDKISAIEGIIVRNANKFRGPRGHKMILDEAGINKNIDKIISISRRSFESYDVLFGQILAAGTGGSSVEDLAGFTNVIENPEVFNFLGVEDIFSRVGSGKKMCLFIGSYFNRPGQTDAKGRSDVNRAYEEELKARARLAKLAGIQSPEYLQYCAENAMHPEEALMGTSGNDMPVQLLNNQLDRLKTNPPDIEIGRMDIENPTLGKFIPDNTLTPFDKFPNPKGMHFKGAVCIEFRPVKDFTYVIGVDPYAQDKSGTASHGAIYVWCIESRRFVAWYVGRLKRSEDLLRTSIALAVMYNNAKTLVENNVPEFNVVYRTHKVYNLLANMPKIVKSMLPNMGKEAATRKGSHKTAVTYNNALNFFRDWMMEADETGQSNVYNINDSGLIRELIRSSESLNFDRLNAVAQLWLLIKEIETSRAIFKEVKADTEVSDIKAHLSKLRK